MPHLKKKIKFGCMLHVLWTIGISVCWGTEGKDVCSFTAYWNIKFLASYCRSPWQVGL